MVFKEGESLRSYYLFIPELGEQSLWLFTEMADKNGLTPDQLGDEIFEFKEISIRFENTQEQDTTIDFVKMCRPGADINYQTPGVENWDIREYQETIGSVQHYHRDNYNVKSYIDMSPGGGQLSLRKENWFFDIDNHADGWAKICLVVRVH